jgi:hypothetical protein
MARKIILSLAFFALIAPAVPAQDALKLRSLEPSLDFLQKVAAGEIRASLPAELLLGDEPVPLPRAACVLAQTACGRAESGFLEAGDCGVDSGNEAVDFYEMVGFRGTTLTIELQSADFDTFLFLLDDAGNVLETDDDSGPGFNSRIQFLVPADGVYVIAATSFQVGEEGPYGLNVRCSENIGPGTCTPSPTALCLADDRFAVINAWATSTDSGTAGVGEITPDTGYLWFFDPNNVEAVVKVLNVCIPPFDRFWVFSGGLTNVLNLTLVADADTGEINYYLNNQDTPYQPIQDTNAFATCP